ncbi:trypsin-like peptidase domain-containing protein [bacterium]|nr:trypsin-like peptidase domain-containing protein [bacterium]
MKKYFIVSLISIAVTSLFFMSQNSTAQQTKATKTLVLPATPLPTLKLNDPLPGNLFVELAKSINPSVVNISTSALARRGPKDPMQEMLERFYGIPPQDDNSWNNKPRRVGLGTGFIIRDDGLILTNAHVIRNADIIEVQLSESSEKQYKADVIGSDQRTDIALIKIKPDVKLTAVNLGSSKDLEVGEWVAAFGNPYGHGHSMTKGIISSKGRAIQEINKIPLLQTDASINPGNSGGPLVNARGQVIGVNSAIDARAQGIGFAIPIDEVKAILPQLEQKGGLQKGYVGLALDDVDNQTAAYLKMDDDNRGSVIVNVQPNGPADKAGLQVYDIVISVDDKKVKNTQDLIDIISDKATGSKIKVKFLRNNKGEAVEKVATLTIIERPDEKKLLQDIFKKQNR